MSRTNFAKSWNASSQPRRQRKFRYNAPLHVRGEFLNAHLSKELRTKYGVRSMRVRKGDKVRVMRGNSKKKEGTVDRVDTKREQVYLTGFEVIKGEGSRTLIPFKASNLMIINVSMSDKKRKKRFEKAGKAESASKKEAKKEVTKPVAEEKKEAKPVQEAQVETKTESKE